MSLNSKNNEVSYRSFAAQGQASNYPFAPDAPGITVTDEYHLPEIIADISIYTEGYNPVYLSAICVDYESVSLVFNKEDKAILQAFAVKSDWDKGRVLPLKSLDGISKGFISPGVATIPVKALYPAGNANIAEHCITRNVFSSSSIKTINGLYGKISIETDNNIAVSNVYKEAQEDNSIKYKKVFEINPYNSLGNRTAENFEQFLVGAYDGVTAADNIQTIQQAIPTEAEHGIYIIFDGNFKLAGSNDPGIVTVGLNHTIEDLCADDNSIVIDKQDESGCDA